MPIALDPSQIFPIYLDSDKEAKPRPEFLFPAVTIRKQRQIFEVSNRMQEMTAEELQNVSEFELMDQTTELFNGLVKGWKNIVIDGQPVEFEVNKAEDVLTTLEMWELLHKVRHNSHVSHEEKKS